MEIWQKTQFEQQLAERRDFILYFYTPTCGVCQLAGQLIEFVEAAQPERHFAKADLNFFPDVAEQHHIRSVPALLKYQNGQLQKISYELNNVTSIFEFVTAD
ncbi:thioredoxin family protein [Listeria costaricensis]|uniref:thioredoxin family protein n=1 Tax=Listeria costaricensis TaxID=2026604 RepID=UPI000C08C93E|nr:thioredoxin family protein [Listeria costaricensis]